MKRIIRKVLSILGFKKLLLALGFVYGKSYLSENGQVKCWAIGYPVNKKDVNFPWWTYSFTDFFVLRINNSTKIFEYGSGNSTIFLSKIVNDIVAVENDKKWFDLLRTMINKNVRLIFKNQDSYVNSIKDDKYDVVIIDGILRNECAFKCVSNLNRGGVIVFDDSDRDDYKIAYDYLIDKGFKRIDFTGLAPCSVNKNSTSIFYKEDNFLEI